MAAITIFWPQFLIWLLLVLGFGCGCDWGGCCCYRGFTDVKVAMRLLLLLLVVVVVVVVLL